MEKFSNWNFNSKNLRPNIGLLGMGSNIRSIRSINWVKSDCGKREHQEDEEGVSTLEVHFKYPRARRWVPDLQLPLLRHQRHHCQHLLRFPGPASPPLFPPSTPLNGIGQNAGSPIATWSPPSQASSLSTPAGLCWGSLIHPLFPFSSFSSFPSVKRGQMRSNESRLWKDLKRMWKSKEEKHKEKRGK